jgi:hypothetical protein
MEDICIVLYFGLVAQLLINIVDNMIGVIEVFSLVLSISLKIEYGCLNSSFLVCDDYFGISSSSCKKHPEDVGVCLPVGIHSNGYPKWDYSIGCRKPKKHAYLPRPCLQFIFDEAESPVEGHSFSVLSERILHRRTYRNQRLRQRLF